MNQNKLISVIVPVYNVEKYLDRCIESIINQTYTNLEIILVDDGSPDNCPTMCDEWAKKDPRIKVIHKANGGVSSARNIGLDCALGDYVSFIDPDDVIDIQMLHKLYNSAIQNLSDIAICGFKYIYENSTETPFIEKNLPLINSKNIIKYFLTTGTETKNNAIYSENIMGSVCRTLIKKVCIQNLRFEKLLVAEDLIFLIDLIDETTKISIVNEPLYGYFQRSTSVIHTFNEHKIEQRYKAFKLILAKTQTKLNDLQLKKFKFFNYASLANEMLKSGQKKLLLKYMQDDFFTNLNTREGYKLEKETVTSLKRKIGFFLIHKKYFSLYMFLVKFR